MNIISSVPFSLWDDVARDCPYSTFFHTSRWALLLRKTQPEMRIATKAFHFGGNNWAVFPLMQSSDDMKGFFKSFYSNVPGVYGGLIANFSISGRQISQVMSHVKGLRTKKVEIFGNPFFGLPDPPSDWVTRANFTHFLNLNLFKTEEELIANYTRGVRKSIDKAKQMGYECRPAERLEDVFAYYDIYLKAISRYGEEATGRQPVEFFINLFNEGGRSIYFWLIEKESRIVGGLISFAHNKHFVAWHAAFLNDEFDGGVAKLMHHRMIMEAKRKGFTVYDFNPSGGHEGTAHFKERFRAERIPFTGYTWSNNKLFHVYHFLRTTTASL